MDIIEALKTRNLAKVEELLDGDPRLLDVQSERGETLALLAAYTGQPEMADLLVARGAKLSLAEAAALGQDDVVAAEATRDPSLVQRLSPDGFTPIALACFFGHAGIVERLLGLGADIEAPAQNALRVRPLHAALAGGHMAIARRLFEAGADVNAVQQAGFTPLHEAVTRGDLEMTTLLIDKGARVDARSDDGRTPLSIAIDKGREAIAELLRARGAA